MFRRPEYSKGADRDRPLNPARQALSFHQITSFHLFLPSPNQERGTALFHHRPTGHRSWKFLSPRAEGMEWCRINDLGLRMQWTFPETRKGILSARDLSALCTLFSLAGEKFRARVVMRLFRGQGGIRGKSPCHVKGKLHSRSWVSQPWQKMSYEARHQGVICHLQETIQV